MVNLHKKSLSFLRLAYKDLARNQGKSQKLDGQYSLQERLRGKLDRKGRSSTSHSGSNPNIDASFEAQLLWKGQLAAISNWFSPNRFYQYLK